MFEKNDNSKKEAEKVCLLTIFVMNILLLAVVAQTVWILYSVIANSEFMEVFAFGKFPH